MKRTAWGLVGAAVICGICIVAAGGPLWAQNTSKEPPRGTSGKDQDINSLLERFRQGRAAKNVGDSKRENFDLRSPEERKRDEAKKEDDKVRTPDETRRTAEDYIEEMKSGSNVLERYRTGTTARELLERLREREREALGEKKEEEQTPTEPDIAVELKYDGYRILAEREGGQVRLRYRRGSDATSLYPDVARALRALPFGDLVLDGELVVLDEESRPSFQRLQRRAQQRRTIDIQRATLELPATLYVFDLLAFEGFDVRPLPLTERKRLLQKLLPAAGPIRFLDHIPDAGRGLLRRGDPPPPRRPHGQACGRPLPRGPVAPVAEAPRRAHRRLRGRGLHRAPGGAHRLRGPPPRCVEGGRPGLLWPRGQRLQRAAAG